MNVHFKLFTFKAKQNTADLLLDCVTQTFPKLWRNSALIFPLIFSSFYSSSSSTFTPEKKTNDQFIGATKTHQIYYSSHQPMNDVGFSFLRLPSSPNKLPQSASEIWWMFVSKLITFSFFSVLILPVITNEGKSSY
jgi:hypothetical protein